MLKRCLVIFYLMILFCHLNGCLNKKEGTYLVLGVRVEKAIENYLEKIVISINDSMKEKGIILDKIEKVDYRRIDIKVETEEFVSPTQEILDNFNFETINPVEGDYTSFHLFLKPQEVEKIKTSILSQTLEIIRSRIYLFGISRLIVEEQDKEKIVVYLPGIKATKRIVDLICKPAQLEFKLVEDDASIDEALKGNISPNDEILYEKILDKETGRIIKRPYLLKKRSLMTGNMIMDTEVKIGGRYGEPYVAISFDKSAAKLFEQITSENIGRRLAIILDRTVYSAPIIREKIIGGYAMITGRFTTEEARDLAIILKAGALPAPVFIISQEFK